MTINNPTEYLGAVEYLERMYRALEMGQSYMSGHDWELFSKGMIRRINELVAAIKDYQVALDLRELTSNFELTIAGGAATVDTPSEASVRWGSPVSTVSPWSASCDDRIALACPLALVNA